MLLDSNLLRLCGVHYGPTTSTAIATFAAGSTAVASRLSTLEASSAAAIATAVDSTRSAALAAATPGLPGLVWDKPYHMDIQVQLARALLGLRRMSAFAPAPATIPTCASVATLAPAVAPAVVPAALQSASPTSLAAPSAGLPALVHRN